MQNVKNFQRGAVPLVLSIIIVLSIIGGGAYLYKQNKQKAPESSESAVQNYYVDDPVFANSPKGVFLARNQALYDASSFEDMMKVSRKYDSQARYESNIKMFEGAKDAKKQAYYNFAQALLIPSSQFYQITESIEGDTAKVTALDQKQQLTTVLLVLEDGQWRVDDTKTLLDVDGKR